MGKSRGNVIYVDDLVDFFGVDAVRYFVLHEMPFDNDGVISWELLVERLNSDLANILGNLVKRTISMSNQYFGGIVADRGAAKPEVDDDLKAVAVGAYAKVVEKMDSLRVADALTEVFAVFRRCNKYIDETEPGVLAKDESQRERLSTVLYNLVEGIVIGASLLEPFMPNTAERIAAQLNTKLRDFDQLEVFGLYENDNRVTDQPEILFARLNMKDVTKREEEVTEKLALELKPSQAGHEEPETADNAMDIPAKAEITYDDFAKLQFQVGEIIACEAVPKSKKLLCSKVKIGSQVKQIVSGIKAYYSPEEMVGKKVMVLVNLKPATLAGVLSEGMLLCAEDAEGNLALMKPEKDMPAGAEVC
ncbi:MAG: methionine--tRNA ligase subunit beta, partial [Acetatifactor sp.]|nr:methionine--tRNA ligase subunit beta [Acetatifactor sp.]